MKKLADKEEMLKVLDPYGNYTGWEIVRSIVHKKQLYHNEIALWIIDKENKRVLLQRRSPNKKINPNKLALCAGHVVENKPVDCYKIQKEELSEVLYIDYRVFKQMMKEENEQVAYKWHTGEYDKLFKKLDKIMKE